VEDGGRMGVLEIARPEREVRAALSQLIVLMAIAIPLLLLIAVVGGLFLAGRALDPIDRITRAAQSIGAEDLSRRLDLHPSPDEVGRLATTFDRMLDRLDRAFRRQQQFTADASHELRTPLALLTSQVDVALERPRRPAEYRQSLASIREDATRMGQLLSELLTLARADAGQESLSREPLALDLLVDDVVATLTPLAETRGAHLEHQPDASEPVMIAGHQTRLTQLVVNLVDNALKYTLAGGTVTVTVGQEGGQATLRVSDTGIGIAPEHLPHLFERFYRIDQARTRTAGGTGLGLALAEWIVHAHGGEIGVASQPGHGTVFTVRLPLLPEHPPVSHAAPIGPAEAGTGRPARSA
jgi:heavy metal sensor kinase